MFLTNIKQVHMVATLIERNTVLTNQRIIHSTIKLRLQYLVLVHYTTDYKTRNSWFNMASKYIAGVGTDIENSCSLLEPPDILTAYCTFVPIFFHPSNSIPQMIFLYIWKSVLKYFIAKCGITLQQAYTVYYSCNIVTL